MKLLPLCMLALSVTAAAFGQLPEWDFTTGADHGWRPNNSLRPPVMTAEGLATALESTDPWLLGPKIAAGAAEARYVQVRLKVGHHGGGSVYFTTQASPQFEQANMVKFRVRPGGRWQELLLDMGSHPGWEGTVTQLRLDPIDVWPNIPAGQPIVVSHVRLLPAEARPAEVELVSFHAGMRWLVSPGEAVEVKAVLANRGGQPARIRRVALRAPDFCGVLAEPEQPSELPAGAQTDLVWRLEARELGAGAVTLTVEMADDERLIGSRRLFAHGPMSAEGSPILSSGRARIVALGARAWGYGTLLLEVADDAGGWTRIATIASLGTVTTIAADGTVDTLELVGAREPRQLGAEQAPGWAFDTTVTDRDGRAWSASLQLEPHHELPLFATRLRVRCDRPAEVRRIDGPTIVMEPAADEARQGGLLGGVEWLEGAERSWSAEVDRSPLRIRYRPHVNRVAVPAMALAQNGGWVGWLWQPGDEPPGVVFGAPTTEATGRDDSVMGLFRPAISTVEGENRDFGMPAMEIEPDEAIDIEGDLLLGPSDGDMARVCRLWIDRFGLPQALPPPRGDFVDELRFTMEAFLETLWVAEENGWLNGIGPSKNIGRFGPFLSSTLMGARRLEGEAGQRCAGRLAETAGTPGGYRGAELPWYEGSLIANFGRRLGGYATSLQHQNDDGGWDFDDWLTMRHRSDKEKLYGLCDPARSEVGFGASYAAGLLRFARVTGDPVAKASGLEALAWMDTFLVPRAAQCWEVPAQAADIVAAADAVQAFVEGYRLTGDRTCRDRAEAWAVRGLPFIYLWDDTKIPGMRYGSTPVLGATWYTGSWYGRPVQWCGLNYAWALGSLIDAGAAEPWSTIRDGLLSSGFHQQFTEPHRRALIPDAIDLAAEGLAADYWVPPYYLALALSHRLGAVPTPHTAVAGDVRVSARGEVTADLRGDRLTVTVAFPERGAHHILVAGVSDVERVLVGGRAIPHQQELLSGDGWQGEPALGLAEVRLETAQRATVLFEGVRTSPVSLLK